VSVQEVAEFKVLPGRGDDFVEVVRSSLPIFRGFPGCHGLQLKRAVDAPDRYLLIIDWDSVEVHMEQFTGSVGFNTFVERFSTLIERPPRAYHTEDLPIGF
jgi:quinol monooxygenase YgiN